MRAREFSPTPGTTIVRTPPTLRSVRRTRPATPVDTLVVTEPSPLHSFEALAGAIFVSSVAACWIAVTSTTTAPLVVAGELLTRVVRVLEK